MVVSEFFKLSVSLNIRRVYRVWAFFRIVIVAEYRVTQHAPFGSFLLWLSTSSGIHIS